MIGHSRTGRLRREIVFCSALHVSLIEMAEPRNPLTGTTYKVTVDVSGERREKSYDPNIPDTSFRSRYAITLWRLRIPEWFWTLLPSLLWSATASPMNGR